MKITLIRHGRTLGNTEKRYIGSTDEPLFDTESLNLSYPEAEKIISSPMKRCLQTAEFIYPNREITVYKNLRECDFGDFENKSYEDLKNDANYIKWLESGGTIPFPNGEKPEAFKRRCVAAFYEALKGDCSSVSFVIHGGTIMAVMENLFGGNFYDYQIRNGGMFCFELDITETNKYIGGMKCYQ